MKFSEIMIKKQSMADVLDLILPRKVSVAIARNLTTINKEIELYNQQREDIAERYAKKDEKGNYVLNGNNYTFANDKDRQSFIEEVSELNDTDIDINIFKFNVSELDRCDESDRYNIITPSQEVSLGWMIDYDE